MSEEVKTRKRKRSEDKTSLSPHHEWKSEHVSLSAVEDDDDGLCGADCNGKPCTESKSNAVYNSSSRVMQCPTCGCEVRRPIADVDYGFEDSSGAPVQILPGAIHNLDDEEEQRREAINDGLVCGHGFQSSAAVVPVAATSSKGDETSILDMLARRLGLPSVVVSMARESWFQLKNPGMFQRVQKAKEAQVALLMLACKRNGTPRPLHMFMTEAGVKQEQVKAATRSMTERGVNWTYCRRHVIRGFVDYYLQLHFKHDASTDETSSEYQLVAAAHRWCDHYVSKCETEVKAEDMDEYEEDTKETPKKGQRAKHETTIAAASILAAYMNDAKLNATYHSALAMTAFVKLTHVSSKSIHACLDDFAASMPPGKFKSYEKAAASPKKKISLLGRRTMKGAAVVATV